MTKNLLFFLYIIRRISCLLPAHSTVGYLPRNKQLAPPPPSRLQTKMLYRLPPFRLGVESDESFGADQVTLPKQLCNVDVERGIRLGRGQKLLDRVERGRDRIHRRPRSLEQVQADLARLEVDVWVTDGSDEANGRRCIGVCVRDLDVEFPQATLRRRVSGMEQCI